MNKFASIEAVALRHSRTDVRWCHLAEVSYVPEMVAVRPGENVTVYCVINDRGANASSAVWMLDMNQTIQRSHYQVVNQRVRWPPPPQQSVPPKAVVLNFLFGKMCVWNR